MSGTLQRPAVAGRDRYHLAADAFLFSGVITLVGFGLQELLVLLVSGGNPDPMTAPVWLEGMGLAFIAASFLAAPIIAWQVHGRSLSGAIVLGGIVGAVVAGPVVGAAFFGLFSLWRFVPAFYPREEMGPWDLGVVVALATLAFLAGPVIAAVRDLTGTKEHVRLDRLRLGALAIVLVAVIVSLVIGGEGAEAGLFAVAFGAGAAMAVVFMDLLARWRARG
ncbi:hypothetical protein [Propioniciclava tarda]|uniref:hypothetical protein n=1 Tax=Propioniciclava tarda TaxID=433330 RepID=UPI001173C01E|nr:hypothetical protein [Propioniciclava tarda]SMO37324.1 hypothetical protein SAMN06266982_101355 [Propioniciclava tarda]